MKKRETYLILDNIRSAHNVGSIFRTADAVGVKKIFLCGITPRPSQNKELSIRNYGSGKSLLNSKFSIPNSGDFGANAKIAKVALGAEKTVPWEYVAQTGRLLKKLKASGFQLVALELAKDSKNIFKYSPRFPMALIVGHERRGIGKKILSGVDDIIKIPMSGAKESLNVSVAAGIAMFQLTRGIK